VQTRPRLRYAKQTHSNHDNDEAEASVEEGAEEGSVGIS
jgi:hypothetical protein